MEVLDGTQTGFKGEGKRGGGIGTNVVKQTRVEGGDITGVGRKELARVRGFALASKREKGKSGVAAEGESASYKIYFMKENRIKGYHHTTVLNKFKKKKCGGEIIR